MYLKAKGVIGSVPRVLGDEEARGYLVLGG